MGKIAYSIKDDGKVDFCMEGKDTPRPLHTICKHEIKMDHRHKYESYIKKKKERKHRKNTFETLGYISNFLA